MSLAAGGSIRWRVTFSGDGRTGEHRSRTVYSGEEVAQRQVLARGRNPFEGMRILAEVHIVFAWRKGQRLWRALGVIYNLDAHGRNAIASRIRAQGKSCAIRRSDAAARRMDFRAWAGSARGTRSEERRVGKECRSRW